MYIRRKVFSVKEENGEQKLFSTTEVQKEFSDKKEEKKDEDTKKEKNLKKAAIAGSGVALAGSATGLSTAIKLDKVVKDSNKKIDKFIDKKGLVRIGDTVYGVNSKRTADIINRYGKMRTNKLKKAGLISSGIGMAGGLTSIAAAEAYKKSKKDKEKNKDIKKKVDK